MLLSLPVSLSDVNVPTATLRFKSIRIFELPSGDFGLLDEPNQYIQSRKFEIFSQRNCAIFNLVHCLLSDIKSFRRLPKLLKNPVLSKSVYRIIEKMSWMNAEAPDKIKMSMLAVQRTLMEVKKPSRWIGRMKRISAFYDRVKAEGSITETEYKILINEAAKVTIEFTNYLRNYLDKAHELYETYWTTKRRSVAMKLAFMVFDKCNLTSVSQLEERDADGVKNWLHTKYIIEHAPVSTMPGVRWRTLRGNMPSTNRKMIRIYAEKFLSAKESRVSTKVEASSIKSSGNFVSDRFFESIDLGRTALKFFLDKVQVSLSSFRSRTNQIQNRPGYLSISQNEIENETDLAAFVVTMVKNLSESGKTSIDDLFEVLRGLTLSNDRLYETLEQFEEHILAS
jgi:hypothetical protein